MRKEGQGVETISVRGNHSPCDKTKQSLSKTLQETQCDRSSESKGQWGQDDGGGDVPGPVLQDLATDGKDIAWEDITVNKTLESPFTS